MRRRPGVTLIELLVVIGIITALATMIVAIAPRFGERQRASRGASQLQNWLNLAKQRALRDRRPVGIRIPYQSNPTLQPGVAYVRELQYIEVPDESIGGTVTVPYPTSGTPNYSVIQLTTTANIAIGAVNALLLPGDVFLIPGPGYAPRQIVSIQPGPNSGTNYTYQIQLDQALTATPSTTAAYRVSRKARPVVGEAVLQMPKDVAIDISRDVTNATPSWYRMFPGGANTGGPNPFDILFSPGGQVIGAEGILGSRICLWVRDVSLNDPDPPTGMSAMYPSGSQATDPRKLPPGPNTLITVYTRTGHVTAHEINPMFLVPNSNPNSNTWNPFQFTQDGLTSGN